MMMSRMFVLASAVALTNAQLCSLVGAEVDKDSSGCCVCKPGYTGPACIECEEGFVQQTEDEEPHLLKRMCGSGRDGSPCTNEGQYPYFGCSNNGNAIGQCMTSLSGDSVFPCLCTQNGGSCESVMQSSAAGCSPRGPRMYTTFPNEPMSGESFDLTVVGCGLKDTDRYLVFPAGEEDQTCEQLAADYTPQATACQMINSDEDDTVDTACLNEGVILQNLTLPSGVTDGSQMSERTFKTVVMPSTGTFKLCAKTAAGWSLVASHNREARDESFNVCGDKHCTGFKGAADNGNYHCDCEDGMNLGDACIPTWMLIIIFLGLIGTICFLCFKNFQSKKKQN